MEIPEINEMDAHALKEYVDNLVRQIPPEERAYRIIRNFFNADRVDETLCERFKAWFTGEEDESRGER